MSSGEQPSAGFRSRPDKPRITVRIGTAGWSIPKARTDLFGADGPHLRRYATRLNAVEINSSFYRSHKPETYARWAADVPRSFRFSVKMPRTITHERRLQDVVEPLDRFIHETRALDEKLGPILVQLPPSLHFDPAVANRFFEALRTRHDGTVVCEPRHSSWFEPPVDALLSGFHVARVAAGPARVSLAAFPGGWPRLI